MQITAQLDDNYAARIVAIQQSTHLDINDIIKQALDLLYTKTTLTFKEKYPELPIGFLNPVIVNSYKDIAKRDDLYDR